MSAASARVLLLLPRQLTMPLRLSLAPPAPSRAASRGYFPMVLQQQQQPHRCWARAAAAASSASSSSRSSCDCEQYPEAPIDASPAGATCPGDGKKGDQQGDGEAAAARGGDKTKAAGEVRPAGRKGRSGAPPSPNPKQQRGRTAKPQGSGGRRRPAGPGPPKEGPGGGGGIIHAAPRSSSSSSASSTSPSSTSSSSSASS